jgi:hypothetical protein
MKSVKILSVITVVVIGCSLFAQTSKQVVPAISTRYSNEEIAKMVEKHKFSHSHDVMPTVELQQKFVSDFPKARDVEWETDGNVYEVEFDVKSRDYKIYYDSQGELLMIVQEIYRSELPAIVKNAAENKYPKYGFEDIDKISRGTDVFYKIELERGNMETTVFLNSDGTVV